MKNDELRMKKNKIKTVLTEQVAVGGVWQSYRLVVC